jgi:hypothetical protein
MSDATIVALYDHYDDASKAVSDIVATGVSQDKVSLLANNLSGDHPALVSNPAVAGEDFTNRDEAQPAAVTGAEVGISIGGVVGVLAAAGALVIPGIGPLIAAGALATIASGAAAGGVIGGAVGMLTEHGISHEDSHLYAEGLKRGGTLVTVVADESQLDAIRQIFKTRGAVDIGKRGASWTAEGWVSFDHEGDHPTVDELAAIRARTNGHAVDHHHDVRHYFHPAGANFALRAS